jgi:hypothetical protein
MTDSALQRRSSRFDGATAHLKVVAILLVWLMAGQVALHHHELLPESASQTLACGVCAFSAEGILTTAPPVRSLVVTAILVSVDERMASKALPLVLSSRGPPLS